MGTSPSSCRLDSQDAELVQGFNAINGSELADALSSKLTYYQVWNSSQYILNEGPQGLQQLDKVVETAGKYGIKVILAFTNNWSANTFFLRLLTYLSALTGLDMV